MTTARSQRDTTPLHGTRLRVFKEEDFADEAPTQPGGLAMTGGPLALGTLERPRLTAQGTGTQAVPRSVDAFDETDVTPAATRMRSARVTEPLPLPRPPRR